MKLPLPSRGGRGWAMPPPPSEDPAMLCSGFPCRSRPYAASNGGPDIVLVVPVIDLMGGQVVHARRGDRSNYRPLESALTRSSDPLEVVRALLAAAPFPAIYAADLDAILQRGDHRETLLDIADRFPSLTLWVDAGFAQASQLQAVDAVQPRRTGHRLGKSCRSRRPRRSSGSSAAGHSIARHTGRAAPRAG